MICINFGIILWKFDQIMRLCGLNFAADPYISSFSFTVLWKKKTNKKKKNNNNKKKTKKKNHTHKKKTTTTKTKKKDIFLY